jgi:hypothetical protein
MNRRELVKSLSALALAQGLTAEAGTAHSRLRAGIVAYSFRKRLADKTMTYEDLIHLASDSGLDGIDTTAYWFPNTSPAFVGGLRTTAYRNGIQLYSLGVRVRLCQPTPELRAAEVANCNNWVDVAERIGAGMFVFSAAPFPRAHRKNKPSAGRSRF